MFRTLIEYFSPSGTCQVKVRKENIFSDALEIAFYECQKDTPGVVFPWVVFFQFQ